MFRHIRLEDLDAVVGGNDDLAKARAYYLQKQYMPQAAPKRDPDPIVQPAVPAVVPDKIPDKVDPVVPVAPAGTGTDRPIQEHRSRSKWWPF